MKILDAAFVTSLPAGGRLPAGTGAVIAMVGRSNVGKSRLVNALARERIARAGAKPGTTRLVNLYAVRAAAAAGRTPRRFTLADLPGYGFTRGGLQARREFDALARGFFDQVAATAPAGESGARPDAARLAGTVLVVDARHPGLASDVAARAWLAGLGAPTIVVTTKNDRLSRSAQAQARRAHDAALGCAVVAVSSSTGDGVRSLWAAIGAVLGG